MKKLYIISCFLLTLFISNTLISSSFAGKIIISNEGSDNISIIDLDTYQIISNIESGKRPRDMKILKDKNQLLVAASEDDIINIIDTNSYKIVGQIETGDDPEIFDISPDEKILVVSNEDDNEATVIDLSSGKINTESPLTIQKP